MKHNFKKIVSLVLTVVMLLGTMSVLIPTAVSAETADPIYLEKNKTTTINGITYRFDVPDSHTSSWARVNADGTWEFHITNGDMLWFPDIALTDSSSIHAEVTNTNGANNTCFSGFAYGVTPNSDGRWDTTMVSVIRSAGRLRVTPANYSGLTTRSGSDWGNGGIGDDRVSNFEDSKVTCKNTPAWYAVVDPTLSNGAPICDWADGKTISFDISRSGNTVTVDFGNPLYGSFGKNTTYDTTAKSSYKYTGGSVGFTSVWAGSSTTSVYNTFRIEEISVSNCKVGGAATASYRIGAGEVIEPHTNFVVNGKTYRWDPLDENKYSKCILLPNGTIRLRSFTGDLLWMPETKNMNGAFMSAKMVNNNGQYNNGNLAVGIAYDIELGDNGVWGDDSDSLITAQTQTSWRRRICETTVAQRNTGCDTLGVQSGFNVESENRNEAYLAWGDRWACGKVLNTSVSINESGNCYASFMNENNEQMTYDYYAINAAERQVLDGPIGFYTFWVGDGSEKGYMTVEIMELYAMVDEPAVSGAQLSLSLDGTIGLNFGFTAANFPDDATVVVTKNGEVIANQAVVNGENVVTAPVNAKEMGDEVNFSVMVDGEVFDEQSYTTSVKAYADVILANADYADWHALIQAMLNYGAAAQKALNYKTDALVADISAIDFDLSDVGNISVTGNTSNLAGLLASVTMESDTALNLYFKTIDGVAPTATVNGEAVEVITTDDGFFRISVAGLAADELSDDMAIVLNGETAISISAVKWAKIVVNGNETDEMKTLAKALAAYADAAKKK